MGATQAEALARGQKKDNDVTMGAVLKEAAATEGGWELSTGTERSPTTSCDEYFSELALWFGLPPGELADVFPNLGNFYSYSPMTPPLGFVL